MITKITGKNGNGGNGKLHTGLPVLTDAKLDENLEESPDPRSYQAAVAQKRMVTVDLCPSCGEGSLVFEESCKKCYACGYSEC